MMQVMMILTLARIIMTRENNDIKRMPQIFKGASAEDDKKREKEEVGDFQNLFKVQQP